MSKVYKVTCQSCKLAARIKIDERNMVFYIDQSPLLASRYRLDEKWGFECKCGNDSRLCVDELGEFTNLVQGAGVTLAKLKKSIIKGNEARFTMEAI
jgi:hypothetical protein